MERHAVLMLAFDQVREQYELTVQALETILSQDIGPLEVLLIDNGSTVPETFQHFQMVRDLYWSKDEPTRIHVVRNRENISPIKVENRALDYLWQRGHKKVLGVANDVMLPPNAYRLMEEWPRGLVCASQTRERIFPIIEKTEAVNECTPAAVCIIRKWFHDALVAQECHFLDEGFFLYASDCDMAMRMKACGIRGIQLNLPYWHHGSAHWRLLSQEDGQKQTNKADADRAYFERKYGFRVDSPEYGQTPDELQFKGVGNKASRKAVAASGELP
jgi:hypothetical protein